MSTRFPKKMTLMILSLFMLSMMQEATFLSLVSAQDTTTQEEDNPTPPTARKKPRGRVPNQYGKLGLSQKQKEEIYSIQAKYRADIEELQQQINDIQLQQASDVITVLTNEQREDLKEILAGVAAKKTKPE